MNILRTSTDQLRSNASRLQLQGDNLAAKVEQMISVVDSIGGAGWSGDAATAYKGQFSELQDDAGRMREFLDGIHEQLEQIAKMYDDAEDAGIQAAQKLPTDIF